MQVQQLQLLQQQQQQLQRQPKQQPKRQQQLLAMYSSTQHFGVGAGQMCGQSVAYYTAQTPQSETTMHQSYSSHHLNHAPHHHHHHYPLSSDSSLGSSGFANSAMRMSVFCRSCCSKKCLFVSCLVLILLIFILVIGLTAYLNFLINFNRTNLIPLSGRLKVDSQGDSFEDGLTNKTSLEFLAKQLKYETILRGAFDRAQNLLRTYPDHLVKCEVYSFRQGSLWVYFRLFINKRTLLHDQQLMKRKSPDEHLDKQFLPRLTQQTLHSGFEQLMIAFNSNKQPPELASPERRSIGAHQHADWRREPRATNQETRAANSARGESLRSFDDQMSRLMPIIESIDLQSIQVSPEFDMLQSGGPINQASMSDNLLATTAATVSSAVMVATGPQYKNPSSGQNDSGSSSSSINALAANEPSSGISSSSTVQPTNVPRPSRQPNFNPPTQTESSTGDEINVSTKKFVLHGYRENSTRPTTTTTTTSSRPSLSGQINININSNSNSNNRDQQTQNPFLVNHQQRKPLSNGQLAGTRINGQPESQVGSNVLIKPVNSLSQPNGLEPNSREKAVVKLVSGQPVLSQSNNDDNNNGFQRTPLRGQPEDDRMSVSSANRSSVTLFPVPLPKVDQFTATLTTPTTTTTTINPTNTSAHRDDDNGNHLERTTLLVNKTGGSRLANESMFMQMLAPYQKPDLWDQSRAEQTANNIRKAGQDPSIQELWSNTLSGGNSGKKNSTTSRLEPQPPAGSQVPAKRLITITTIGGKDQNFLTNSNVANLDWHKISILSPDISDTIRAQINGSLATTTTTTPTGSTLSQSAQSSSTTTASPGVSQQSSFAPPMISFQKPKVSPHLKQGGSIVSSPSKQSDTHSAIVLNRDFHQIHNSNNDNHDGATSPNVTSQQQLPSTTTTSSTTTTTPTATRSASSGSAQSRAKKLHRKPHGGIQRNSTSSSSSSPPLTSSTAANETQKQRSNTQTKPTIEQHKVKKVSDPARLQDNGSTMINSKGIRIVDNFLASLDSNLNRTGEANKKQLSGGNNNNRTQLESVGEADANIGPTLPTTIELTRSTTANPPSRTTHIHHNQPDSHALARANSAADTTSSPQAATTAQMTTATPLAPALGGGDELSSPEQPTMSTILANQALKPGTSSFSNQWKPLAANGNRTSLAEAGDQRQHTNSRPSTRRPNLSLIIGAQRPAINVPSNQGSQSPFAMPATAANQDESQLFRPMLATGLRRINKLSNTYQLHNSGRGGGNEFESHRMSRMRQNEALSSSTSTTLSSLNLMDSNTRIVDDFMITTDKIEGNTRSSTLIPPLVLSGLHKIDPLVRMRAMNPVDLHPKRTRGPFAFETLVEPNLGPNEMVVSSAPIATAMDEDYSNQEAPFSLVNRAERSPARQSGAEQKLLLRKKLFLGQGAEDDELNSSSSTNPPVILGANELEINLMSERDGDRAAPGEPQSINPKQLLANQTFGNRKPQLASPPGLGQYRQHHQQQQQQQQQLTSSNSSNADTDLSFRCQYYGCRAKGSLKFTCLNYTQICDDFIDCQDESDELDCVSLLKHDSKSNRLIFSNGGGIIYLNRKGSLAPMCIDYFSEPIEKPNKATNSAHDLDVVQFEMIKKQQELIRQINTIGQYACSLQSFSRLVSVKINHHSLVDSSNLIKNSKLYHRLSIVGHSDKHDFSPETSFGSYKSGTSDHEVEVSTSSECPSQRTVFVKCGSFECGQDSFSIIDQTSSASKRSGIIINDFPWLVKLYWSGKLACHGYLIDELWLIFSSECFANRTRSTEMMDDHEGWTAEISYEHYGNDDYQSIESNRRTFAQVLEQPIGVAKQTIGSSIVLAKFEKPVRFSPLNRPICLPLPTINNQTLDSDLSRSYKECVTATLPIAGSAPPSQDLLLNKVEIHKVSDCIRGEFARERLGDVICVSELTRGDDKSQIREDDSTRVLICSTVQASRLRSKWTVVGVQNKADGLLLDQNKQLFTTVSSQIDWIVDTMNPKLSTNQRSDESNTLSGNVLNPISATSSQNKTCNRFRCSSGECLSWSRICDGLYDCSSHEDEKDCHK